LAGAEQQGVAISRDYQALETRTSFAKKRLKQLQTELTCKSSLHAVTSLSTAASAQGQDRRRS
jgi:hypothetical protein